MALSDKEKRMLARLQEKEKEPSAPSAGRMFNISVDLGDTAQVEAARKLGLSDLLRDDDDDDDDGTDDDDSDTEDTPRRRGYFDNKS